MKLVKDLFKKIKKIFYIKNKPIGLKALGVKLNYLGTFYSFNYSKNRFYKILLSPVQYPYYLI